MLLITPNSGPLPRPIYLLTGDRATKVLDATSSAALQAKGVNLATLSLSNFNALISTLVPPTVPGIDPVTGKLTDKTMPDYLSVAAINALNLLDPNTHQVEEQFIPDRLSQTSINAMVLAQNSTVVDTDPDGYPVVVGGSDTTTDFTVTGTLTAGTSTAATGHADILTANQFTTTYSESTSYVTDNQTTEPASPAIGKLRQYSDANGRVVWKDQEATLWRASSKRIVTSWPLAADSYLGDEAIDSNTGEHRIYLGTSKGWRLASPHEVSSLTERDALTNLYPGYRVYVTSGQDQIHVWQDDNKWHGTKSFRITGAPFSVYTNVNDTNWRRIGATTIVDPGYPYHVTSRVNMHIAGNAKQLAYLWVQISDPNGTGNLQQFSRNFKAMPNGGEPAGYLTFPGIAGMTDQVQEGTRLVTVLWMVNTPNAKATNPIVHSGHSYDVIPA